MLRRTHNPNGVDSAAALARASRRICKTCKEEKDVSDFKRNPKRGWRWKCLACCAKYDAEWARNNPDRVRENSRLWCQKNPEKRRAITRRYRESNRDGVRESNRRWFQRYAQENPDKVIEKRRRHYYANPEKSRERSRRNYHKNKDVVREKAHLRYLKNRQQRCDYSRRYREENIDKVREAGRKWGKENPDKIRANNHRRRARKRGAPGTHTAQEWADLCARYDHRCLCCGMVPEKMTVDHVVPISLGGSNDIGNLQPLCLSCNSSKNAKTIDYRRDAA